MTDCFRSTLPVWINAVDISQLPGLTGFAPHLLRGLDAVTAVLTLHWSSGGTEGAVSGSKKDQTTALWMCRIRTTPQMILFQCPSAAAPQDL
ncbi:hypothetical protein [Streptomyces europaeiscabiei]|uniref:hypothetical protein n=1 Tax=Streptomyces europaeiscabiei TaxID=146819 RepID=UPI0038F7FC4F